MGKHILIWLGILLATLIAVPFIFPTDTIWGAITKEAILIQKAFGTEDAERVVKRAGAVHQAVFIDTNILKGISSAKTSRDEERFAMPGSGQLLARSTNGYLDSLGALIYGISMRIVILFDWLPYIIPFLLGAAGEGLARRKIKFATFGQYGVMVYAGAVHLSIILGMAPLLYLVAPFPVTPLFVPFWALIGALPVVLMISNASQILPK